MILVTWEKDLARVNEGLGAFSVKTVAKSVERGLAVARNLIFQYYGR